MSPEPVGAWGADALHTQGLHGVLLHRQTEDLPQGAGGETRPGTHQAAGALLSVIQRIKTKTDMSRVETCTNVSDNILIAELGCVLQGKLYLGVHLLNY